MKNLYVQFLREKILILFKDKRFFKFLIIGERQRTTTNGREPLRTAICRSFFEASNGQNSRISIKNKGLFAQATCLIVPFSLISLFLIVTFPL
jgi:hypothetical protein